MEESARLVPLLSCVSEVQMRSRKYVIGSVITIGLILMLFNHFVRLEYDINLIDFIRLSGPYSHEEKQYLLTREHFIYGGNINEPPLGIYEPSTSQYVGLVVDYINALSIPLEVPILSRPMVWKDALEALALGETDFCDMIPSEARSERFDFSNPLYQLRGLVVVRSEKTDMTGYGNLVGKRVAAQKEDYAIEAILRREPTVEIVEVDSLEEAFSLLDQGIVSALIGDEPVIWYSIQKLSTVSQYRFFKEPLYEEPVVVAVAKGEQVLIQLLNRSILALRRNGTLDQINVKWRAYAPLLTSNRELNQLQYRLMVLVGFLVIAGVVVFLVNRSLADVIAQKTATLQYTFDSMDRFIVVMHEDGTILNANRAFLNYCGLVQDELLGTQALDMPIIEAGVTFLKKEEEGELLYDGRWYEVKGHGKKLGVELLMLKDITYEKAKQRQLIHSSRMEAIGQLAAGVAHELRNPLGVIRNSTYLLEDLVEDASGHVSKSIGSINKSVSRASHIIDNLLNFSSLSSDRISCIHISDILDELLSYFKTALPYKHLTFRSTYSQNLYLSTREDSFRHIIINIMTNACESIEAEGTVMITASEQINESGDKCIVIAITDTGKGIDELSHRRIFDPFYTTKPPGEGTGLGLYLVYSELMKIRGSIEVSSEINSGTCMRVRLEDLVQEAIYE
jgi:PAS domain S-box-containing protein